MLTFREGLLVTFGVSLGTILGILVVMSAYVVWPS